MEKFKIIIFDLIDGKYGTYFDDENIKKYINKGGNVIFTHDKRMNSYYYQTKSYTTKIKINDHEHPVFSSYYNINTTTHFQIYEKHS